MKTSKKLLAFLLSAVMVLSLVVSVSVVASAEAADFYFNDFDAEPTTSDAHIKNFTKDNFSRSFDAEKGEWTFVANVVTTNSTSRLFNIEGFTYQKGHSYDIIVGAKGVPAAGSSKAVKVRAMSPLSSSGTTVVIKNAAGTKHSYTGGTAVTLNAETVTEAKLTYMVYDIQKKIDNVYTSVDSTTLTFGIEIGTSNVIGDTVIVDYVKIIDNAPRTGATFTIDNGITVTTDGQTVVSGSAAQEAHYGDGLPTSFTAEVPAGKSARVIVDGNKLTAGSGTFAFTVPADAKTVEVELVDNKIIYANYFNASTDTSFVSPNGYSASKISDASSPNNGKTYLQYEVKDGALRAYFIAKSGTRPKYGGTRLFNMKFGDAYFEGGHKYQINLKYKTSESYGLQMQQGSVWMQSESSNNYYKGPQVTTSTDYSTYSYTFDFYGRGTNKYAEADLPNCYFYESQDVSATMGLYANIESANYDGDEEIIIDEVEVIDLGMALDTVTLDVASEGGSFKRFYQYSTSATNQGYVPVNSTKAYGKADGKELKFEIIPEEGKVALVKYYDEVKIIKVGDDYNFAFKVDKGDTVLSVKFIDENATAEIAKTEILFRNGAVYVYGYISDFAKGAPNYGVRLWNTADEETVWELKACADADQTLAVAKSGQAFAIKAYGNLISEDNTYAAKAYVGDDEGEIVTTADAK